MRVNPYVFWPAAALIFLFVLAGALFSGPMGTAFGHVQGFIVEGFGWFYILAVAFFLLFVLWLPFSRFAHVRLGKDDDRPEFSYFTWFAMLFSAGMGIGLVFYGVAEPIMHFGNPPRGTARGVDAAREAMNITFFHWGLHAWAIYIVVGLSLSYFAYRHDLPLTIRSTLYPLLGRHVHGPVGHVIDVLAVFGTLFGLATSLGLGVMQINAGLEYLGLLSVSRLNQILLITAITLAATASVVSGVGKGIRRLSELNMAMATLLLVFVFLAGPTVFLLSNFVQSTGRYASSLVEMTFRTDAFIGLDWQKGWTMFYWGWWISWSPFVGMFIARVSRGRTVREFVTGVLLVPTLLTFFWMVVFGGTAIHLDQASDGAMVKAVTESVPTAVFVMLNELPFSAIAATLTTIVVAIFFVTSSDSGSLVIDILTSGGHPAPPVGQKIFWALMVGAVSAILLVAGGLGALQTAAITTALPFAGIMVLICVSLFVALRAERTTHDPLAELWSAVRRIPESAQRHIFRVPAAATTRTGSYADTAPSNAGVRDRSQDWRERLRQITAPPAPAYHEAAAGEGEARDKLRAFIEETVVPAFARIEAELEHLDRGATIERDAEKARITVTHRGEEEFTYAVEGHVREDLVFAFPKFDTRRGPPRLTAEVVLRSGKHAEHPVRDLGQERIIADFVDAYAKWMGW